MSKSRLGLKEKIEADKVSAAAVRPTPLRGGRDNKKALIAYFSSDLSKTIARLAIDEDTTMQALIGEAIDLLMESRGKHRFGER